jgi:flavin-dependent dehydrogenase
VLHLFRGGYLGLSRVEGGAVNLAALATIEVAKAAHEDFDVLLARLRIESPALARDLEGLSPEAGPVLLSEPVHLVPREPWAGDVLLAGDAAGLLDPWTGRGMGKALSSGRLAGDAVEQLLAGRAGASALRALHARDERRLARGDFVRSRLLRPVFTGGFGAGLVHPAASPLARALVRWVAA